MRPRKANKVVDRLTGVTTAMGRTIEWANHFHRNGRIGSHFEERIGNLRGVTC